MSSVIAGGQTILSTIFSTSTQTGQTALLSSTAGSYVPTSALSTSTNSEPPDQEEADLRLGLGIGIPLGLLLLAGIGYIVYYFGRRSWIKRHRRIVNVPGHSQHDSGVAEIEMPELPSYIERPRELDPPNPDQDDSTVVGTPTATPAAQFPETQTAPPPTREAEEPAELGADTPSSHAPASSPIPPQHDGATDGNPTATPDTGPEFRPNVPVHAPAILASVSPESQHSRVARSRADALPRWSWVGIGRVGRST